MSNVFDRLKREIEGKFPHYTTLPLLKRFKAWLGLYSNSEYGLTEDVSCGKATQFAILIDVDGVQYLRRFGRLS